MPKKNSSKNKSAPQGAAVLADKLKGVLSAGTSGQAAAQLLHLHDEFGGQNFQKLVTLGWASTDESTREGLDAALAACFENSGDPLQWRHPFTNIAVIVIKNIPLKYAANSAVVAWLRRNYRCLSLNTKALLFEQMLLDSAPLEGGAGGAAAAGPPLDAAGVVARKSLDSDTGDRVFYVRHMMSLIDEAESRQNFRAGMSVLVSGLSRCPPITTISVDRLNRLMYAAIQCDQSSHIGVLSHTRLQAAIHGQSQLEALVKGLQRTAVEALVNASQAKSAMKLFRKFKMTESDCPQLRSLCERSALSWHVGAEHLDILEGQMSRRADLVPVVQDLWKSKKKGQRIEEFVAERTGGYAHDFEKSSESLLCGLRQIVDRQDAELEASNTASAGDEESVYQTRCRGIVMVDTLSAVQAMVTHVRDVSEGVFAFDCEWTPTLSAFDQQFCAILTICTRTRGFLVDCLALRTTAEEAGPGGSSSIAELLDSMFGSPNLVSVGYSTQGDLKTLRVTFPSVRSFVHIPNHVDMSLGKHVRSMVTPQLISLHQRAPHSLSLLVQTVLNVSLPKSSQVSDWERRPLRPAQIKYAINDADCLLALWDKSGLVKTLNYPFLHEASTTAAVAAPVGAARASGSGRPE